MYDLNTDTETGAKREKDSANMALTLVEIFIQCAELSKGIIEHLKREKGRRTCLAKCQARSGALRVS